MDSFTAVISYLAISQLVFLICSILLKFRTHVLGNLLVLFNLCLISYILTTTPIFVFNPVSSFILYGLAVATPAILWLLAALLFVDSKKVPAFAVGFIVLYMFSKLAGHFLLIMEYQFDILSFSVTFIFPQVAMLGFSVHAIYLGIVGRKDDLVEERRSVRVPFVISMGIFAIIIISSGFLVSSTGFSNTLPVQNMPSLFLASYAFLMSLIMNLAIFTLNAETVALISEPTRFSAGRSKFVRIAKKRDLKLIAKIRNSMEEEKMYRRAGLTIVELARALSVPDYRLRKIINKQMNFRNFNQFINNYRIKEASKLLEETDEPISIIALDVGYVTLSSFNQVFKESHGVPPREFRTLARTKQIEAD